MLFSMHLKICYEKSLSSISLCLLLFYNCQNLHTTKVMYKIKLLWFFSHAFRFPLLYSISHHSGVFCFLFFVFVRCKTCSLTDPSGGCVEGRFLKDRTWDNVQWRQGMVVSWRNAEDRCRSVFVGCELSIKWWEPIGTSAQTHPWWTCPRKLI